MVRTTRLFRAIQPKNTKRQVQSLAFLFGLKRLADAAGLAAKLDRSGN
jgi:hypothetical protein